MAKQFTKEDQKTFLKEAIEKAIQESKWDDLIWLIEQGKQNGFSIKVEIE